MTRRAPLFARDRVIAAWLLFTAGAVASGRNGSPCIARHTAAGVRGMSACRMPNGASASTTALTVAAGEPTVADSPMPLAPPAPAVLIHLVGQCRGTA